MKRFMSKPEKFSDRLDEDQVREFAEGLARETGPMTAEERERIAANVRGLFEFVHMALIAEQHERGEIDESELVRQQEIAMINLGEPPEAVEDFHRKVKLQDAFVRKWRDEEIVMNASGLSLWYPAVNRLSTEAIEGGHLVMTGEAIMAASTPDDHRHTEAIVSALEQAAVLLENDLDLKKIRKLAEVRLPAQDGQDEEVFPELPEVIHLRTGWHCLFRSRFMEEDGGPRQAIKLQRQAFGELVKAGDFIGAAYVRYREVATLRESGQSGPAEQKLTTLVDFIAKHREIMGNRASSALLWMAHERADEFPDSGVFRRLVRTIEEQGLVEFMEAHNLRSAVPSTVRELFRE